MTEKKPELSFPCEYPVRVMGKDEDQFELLVMEIISRHVPELRPEHFSSKRSGNGNYLSVSFKFIAESRAQVDAMNNELGSHKRVLVVL